MPLSDYNPVGPSPGQNPEDYQREVARQAMENKKAKMSPPTPDIPTSHFNKGYVDKDDIVPKSYNKEGTKKEIPEAFKHPLFFKSEEEKSNYIQKHSREEFRRDVIRRIPILNKEEVESANKALEDAVQKKNKGKINLPENQYKYLQAIINSNSSTQEQKEAFSDNFVFRTTELSEDHKRKEAQAFKNNTSPDSLTGLSKTQKIDAEVTFKNALDQIVLHPPSENDEAIKFLHQARERYRGQIKIPKYLSITEKQREFLKSYLDKKGEISGVELSRKTLEAMPLRKGTKTLSNYYAISHDQYNYLERLISSKNNPFKGSQKEHLQLLELLSNTQAESIFKTALEKNKSGENIEDDNNLLLTNSQKKFISEIINRHPIKQERKKQLKILEGIPTLAHNNDLVEEVDENEPTKSIAKDNIGQVDWTTDDQPTEIIDRSNDEETKVKLVSGTAKTVIGNIEEITSTGKKEQDRKPEAEEETTSPPTTKPEKKPKKDKNGLTIKEAAKPTLEENKSNKPQTPPTKEKPAEEQYTVENESSRVEVSSTYSDELARRKELARLQRLASEARSSSKKIRKSHDNDVDERYLEIIAALKARRRSEEEKRKKEKEEERKARTAKIAKAKEPPPEPPKKPSIWQRIFSRETTQDAQSLPDSDFDTPENGNNAASQLNSRAKKETSTKQENKQPKKKGFFSRLFGIFSGQ